MADRKPVYSDGRQVGYAESDDAGFYWVTITDEDFIDRMDLPGASYSIGYGQ